MAKASKSGGFKNSVTAGDGKQGFAKSKAAPKPARAASKAAKAQNKAMGAKKDRC